MIAQPLYLVDQSSARVAVLHVERNGDHYQGTICLDATPPALARLFKEFEENVEGQMFTLADEVEQQIEARRLRIVAPDGKESPVEDLQVFPSTGLVSFKTCQPSSRPAGTNGEQQEQPVKRVLR
jgi:hypothetical protein